MRHWWCHLTANMPRPWAQVLVTTLMRWFMEQGNASHAHQSQPQRVRREWILWYGAFLQGLASIVLGECGGQRTPASETLGSDKSSGASRANVIFPQIITSTHHPPPPTILLLSIYTSLQCQMGIYIWTREKERDMITVGVTGSDHTFWIVWFAELVL